MKKFTRSALAAAVLTVGSTGGVAFTSTASAELSMNIGAVSNYYFRGVTQTDDAAAIQGGVDFEHESGFYAGTWASTVDFGEGEAKYELDLYAGFAGELGNGMGYDVGYIYYAYPDSPDDIDFGEIYGELSFAGFYGGLAATVHSDQSSGEAFDSGDIYYYLGYDVALPNDFGLDLTAGYYTFDADGSAGQEDLDYLHYGATMYRDVGDFGEVSFTLEYADIKDDDRSELAGSGDDLKVWVGWSKTF
ncbi:hypothetical protein TVD_01360 [Thioalkalivibrio versutus]|uniref:Histidine kinase n=1 Tax=Thioalkalivibrio versutus TaxID=106634 RepID=A0A0G3G549_9GAMM|nr:TorF family putative porin [Thioalkalivibrio versutus]AKJ96380.1 hypothetical protein TVD_01360 [Thioalkalivibrio versutus]